MAMYEGTTVKEAIIKAMMAVCRPCGCPGAGSGSPGGVGGREKALCCDSAVAALISWDITGTTGAPACVSGTEAPNEFDCLIEPDDQNGFRCGPAAAVATVATYAETCVVDTTTTTIVISLCCAEPEDPDPVFPARYRMAIYLTVDDGVTFKAAQWCTEEFDFVSCDPFHVEVVDLAPLFDDFGGAILNLVIT